MKIPDESASASTPSDLGGISDTIKRALAAAGLGNLPQGTQPSIHSFAKTLPNPSNMPGCFQTGPHDVIANHLSRKILPREPSMAYQQHVGTASAEETHAEQFTSHAYRGPAGVLDYKLYVPLSYAARPSELFPLIVMLHGCTQSPDDFAAGTRMNQLAETHGFLVAYPAQAAAANASRCWNWFRAEDQRRDAGEPSMIAGITREVVAHYRIDKRRIFVAGLSAGAAMAVILGATYPDLYAGVGAHSGLAHGAAHDVSSALTAMRNGSHGTPGRNGQRVQAAQGGGARSMPTIVFHGDRDNTVNVKNGIEIVEHATVSGNHDSGFSVTTEEGGAANESKFTRTVYAYGNRPLVEYWLLHGSGHAWSGGSSKGSFTDAHGPDASSAMVRFFYAQPL